MPRSRGSSVGAAGAAGPAGAAEGGQGQGQTAAVAFQEAANAPASPEASFFDELRAASLHPDDLQVLRGHTEAPATAAAPAPATEPPAPWLPQAPAAAGGPALFVPQPPIEPAAATGPVAGGAQADDPHEAAEIAAADDLGG